MNMAVAAIASRCLAFSPCSFPQVIAKMQRIAVDPDCSIPLVGSIMLSDPMISALVVSRAGVGRDLSTTTISASIAKLGMAGVQGLCQDIEAIPEDLRGEMAAHWSHANAAAHMCRLLARFCHADFPQRGDDETLTVIGLLHDLGNPAARLLFPQNYAAAEEQLCDETTSDFQACMRQQLGVCCYHVGALIARAWHLPEDVCAVIRHHHDPERAIDHREVVALTHIAHNLVKGCGFTAGADIYVAPIQPSAMATLGLRQNDLIAAIKRYYEEIEELALYEASFAGSG